MLSESLKYIINYLAINKLIFLSHETRLLMVEKIENFCFLWFWDTVNAS